jgi:hypothetical protein
MHVPGACQRAAVQVRRPALPLLPVNLLFLRCPVASVNVRRFGHTNCCSYQSGWCHNCHRRHVALAAWLTNIFLRKYCVQLRHYKAHTCVRCFECVCFLKACSQSSQCHRNHCSNCTAVALLRHYHHGKTPIWLPCRAMAAASCAAAGCSLCLLAAAARDTGCCAC